MAKNTSVEIEFPTPATLPENMAAVEAALEVKDLQKQIRYEKRAIKRATAEDAPALERAMIPFHANRLKSLEAQMARILRAAVPAADKATREADQARRESFASKGVQMAVTLTKTVQRVESRLRYEALPMLEWTGERFKFSRTVRAASTIDLLLHHLRGTSGLDWVEQANRTPRELDPARQKWVTPAVKSEGLAALRHTELGVNFHGKYFIPSESLIMGMLMIAFPLRIDFKAYAASLFSAILPDGGLKMDVRIKDILLPNGQPRGFDGAGEAHPSLIAFSSQFRALKADAFDDGEILFAKGMLVPSDRCVSADGTPEIWLDRGQIKGAAKKVVEAKLDAGEEIVLTGVSLGLLRAFNAVDDYRLGYQQLQLLQTNEESAALVKDIVASSMERMFGRGVDGLIEGLVRDDEQIAAQVKFAEALDIPAIDVPAVRNLVEQRLAKQLYFAGQGAGVMAKQYAIIMDNSLNEGEIVIKGVKVGTQAVAYRFPTTLPQGLVKVTVVEPRDHMLANGEVPVATLFMSPLDATNRMQGDDDGDAAGLIFDPRFVKLHGHRIKQPGVLMVEPEKVKRKALVMAGDQLTTEEREALESPVENGVGRCSILQARLYAVGAKTGNFRPAFVASIAIQEQVDYPKSDVDWTSLFEAFRAQWEKLDVASKAPHFRPTGAKLAKGKDPVADAIEFAKGYFKHAGVTRPTKDGPVADFSRVCQWRSSDKRVSPENFRPVGEVWNLVDVAWNEAAELWATKYVDLFRLTPPDHTEVAAKAADACCEALPEAWGWDQYKILRSKLGLRDYQDAVRAAVGGDPQQTQDRVSMAFEKLRKAAEGITMEEQLQVLVQELSNEKGSRLAGFMVACLPGTPISEALSLEEVGCDFLEGVDLDVIGKRLVTGGPEFLVKCFNGEKHFQARGIYAWECPTCSKAIEDLWVYTHRGIHGLRGQDEMKAIVSNLNRLRKEFAEEFNGGDD